MFSQSVGSQTAGHSVRNSAIDCCYFLSGPLRTISPLGQCQYQIILLGYKGSGLPKFLGSSARSKAQTPFLRFFYRFVVQQLVQQVVQQIKVMELGLKSRIRNRS